jgi:alkylated DNA nucleotide flippase Atl1
MTRVDSDFKDRVYDIVVGQIAHTGPANLPWQRVVNKSGGLARGYPGGFEGHKKALEAEGIAVNDEYKVDIGELLWQPPNKNQSSLL